jgi:histidinol-phosphate phosphatase family protein
MGQREQAVLPVMVSTRVKVVILDRDGVINRYPGHGEYVKSLKAFKFLPNAKKAIKLLTDAGYAVFVVSNQAGVARGLYSQKTLDAITSFMCSAVEKIGGSLRGVYYCTHLPEDNCRCRKPKIGNIRKALRSLLPLRADRANSYFIGDSMRDIHAGKNARLQTILVLSGREDLSNRPNWSSTPDYIASDLFGACRDIVLRGSVKKRAA